MISITSLLFWLIVIGLAVLKLYQIFNKGVCKSKRRLDGKIVIVTGSNTGIGKETARDLARRGAKVIMACRDLKRAKEACEDIIATTGNTKVEVRHLDLSSLESVRSFAKNIIASESRLDVLVNNAGAGFVKKTMTKDNLEMGMQVNHFGPFLLTCLLVDLMKKSAPSRIVMVSSWTHVFPTIDIDNLNSEKWYKWGQVYSFSKLANVITANELARRLKGTGVTANSLHPGTIHSDVWRHIPPILHGITVFIMKAFFKDTVEGAQTSIHVAVAEELEGVTGKYFCECKESSPSQSSLDEGLAKKLWERTETLIGMKPEERLV